MFIVIGMLIFVILFVGFQMINFLFLWLRNIMEKKRQKELNMIGMMLRSNTFLKFQPQIRYMISLNRMVQFSGVSLHNHKLTVIFFIKLKVEICKIICNIEAIDTDWTWFYFGCNRHNKRVNKIPKVDYGRMSKSDKPLFRCDICNANVTNVSPK